MTKNIFLETLYQDLFSAQQVLNALEERKDLPQNALASEDFNEAEANLRAGKVDNKLIPIVMMHVDNIRKEAEHQRDIRYRAEIDWAKADIKRRETIIENYLAYHYQEREQ